MGNTNYYQLIIIQYLLSFANVSSILVTPTHVCYVSSLPQTLFFFVEKASLFVKGVFWSPQAIFATFQACRRRFFLF